VGVGAGVLLACWGLSLFFHYDSPVVKRLDDLGAQLETMSHSEAETLKTLTYNVGQLVQKIGQQGVKESAIEERLATIGERLELALKRQNPANSPIIGVNTGSDGNITNGSVIETEVTVFHTVKHEGGAIQTGWKYPDGASADQRPKEQYCLYLSDKLAGTTAAAAVYLADDGVRLQNIGPVPKLEKALRKCVWWTGS
jgi:hypothetical protein